MMTKLAVVTFSAALLAIACSGGSFVPGVSPTVTPYYNPEGTPSVPIVITPDLPEGWRWQFSHGFPIPDKGAWLLLDDNSELVGAVGQPGNTCWIVFGDDTPGEPTCYDRDEVGRRAVKVLVTNYKNQLEATATIEPKTPLDAFMVAFTPDAGKEHQVRELDDRSFAWTASVYGSGLYQITECPSGTTAPAAGRCVQGQLANTTRYTMTDVQVVCDGIGNERTPPMQIPDPMRPGTSASWLWVRSPIAEPYSCTITWAVK